MMGFVLPMGGGGTFRLFPLFLMKKAIAQVFRAGGPPTAMLYFHPWEFDGEQEQLPLGALSRFRTYNGIAASRGRLDNLMSEGRSFVPGDRRGPSRAGAGRFAAALRRGDRPRTALTIGGPAAIRFFPEFTCNPVYESIH